MSGNRSSSPFLHGESDGLRSGWTLDHRSRLVRVCYAVAMLAASLATFGWAGFWPGVAIVATWAWVFFRTPRTQGLTEAAFVWVVLFILLSWCASV
jgi:hypothetical protein